MKTAVEIFILHKDKPGKHKPLTAEQEYAKLKSKKQNKYRNKSIIIDGILFQSTGEGNYYITLKHMKLSGEIQDFKRQIPFEFIVNGVRIGKYICDFGILHFNGSIEIIDHKSEMTVKLPEYEMKKQLMLACYGVAIKEVGIKK